MLLGNLPYYFTQHCRIPANSPDVLDDRTLQRGRGHRLRRALVPSALVRLHAHVVSVERVLLLDVGVDHPRVATCAPHDPFKQCAVLIADVAAAAPAVPVQGLLHSIPDLVIHNALLLAGIDLAVEFDFAGIDGIGEHIVERGLRERAAARAPSLARGPGLHLPTAPVKFLDHRNQGAVLKVEAVDLAYPLRLVLVHDQPATLRRHVVPQHEVAPNPFSLAARRPHLVAGAFGDHLALELGEGEQDVQR